MRLADVGEFGLIERIEAIIGREHTGDDAAVLRNGEIRLHTADMLVQGVHFLESHPPFKLGRKAMCSNLSDIAAMGGRPMHALVSIGMPPETEVEWVEELYRGMNGAIAPYGEIIGGDTVRSAIPVISVSVEGVADENSLTYRSGASVGDVVFVSGDLGGSKAGLLAMMNGISAEDAIERHLDPGCRADIGPDVGRIASAMMDISDGLASEAGHIAEMSGVGIEIYAEKLPLHPSVEKVAKALDTDGIEIALSSGEEYELLFTVNPENLKEAEGYGTAIGKVVNEGVYLVRDGKRRDIKVGYAHFTSMEN